MQSPSGPKVYQKAVACSLPLDPKSTHSSLELGWLPQAERLLCSHPLDPKSTPGGAGQAAERVARAGARQLGGWCVAAGRGPALGLACRSNVIPHVLWAKAASNTDRLPLASLCMSCLR